MTNPYFDLHQDAIVEALTALCVGYSRKNKVIAGLVNSVPLTTIVLDDDTLTFSGPSGVREHKIKGLDLVGTGADTTEFVKNTTLTEVGRDAIQTLQDQHRRQR